MALIKVKESFKTTQRKTVMVFLPNVFDYNSIKFAVMAAEEAHMPLTSSITWF